MLFQQVLLDGADTRENGSVCRGRTCTASPVGHRWFPGNSSFRQRKGICGAIAPTHRHSMWDTWSIRYSVPPAITGEGGATTPYGQRGASRYLQHIGNQLGDARPFHSVWAQPSAQKSIRRHNALCGCHRVESANACRNELRRQHHHDTTALN